MTAQVRPVGAVDDPKPGRDPSRVTSSAHRTLRINRLIAISALGLGLTAAAVTVVLAITHHYTRYRVPPACQTAANQTVAHLTSLTAGVGSQVKVSAIQKDEAALLADCGVP